MSFSSPPISGVFLFPKYGGLDLRSWEMILMFSRCCAGENEEHRGPNIKFYHERMININVKWTLSISRTTWFLPRCYTRQVTWHPLFATSVGPYSHLEKFKWNSNTAFLSHSSRLDSVVLPKLTVGIPRNSYLWPWKGTLRNRALARTRISREWRLRPTRTFAVHS